MLKKIAVLFCLFCSGIACGQANKSLNDSVFKQGDVIRFPSVVFALSKPCCWAEQLDSIKLVADFLEKHPELKAEVAVHTDDRGSLKGNDALSDFRARTVRDALITYFKIDPSQVSYKGYGESKPLINNVQIKKAKTEEEQQKLHSMNQRMELIVTDFESR